MKKSKVLLVVLITVYAIIALSMIAWAAGEHTSLTWNGPGTCLVCHEADANEVHGSAHYQWEGQALYMVNGAPLQGKLKTSVNSYCGNIIGNWGCSSCHIGLGKKPNDTTLTQRQHLENIDCLLCHQKDYKRKKDAVTGLMVPDTSNMTISMNQAVQTVHKPVRQNCLQCHAKGGGGDNYKRGDIAVAHVNTTDRNFDVHMATTGANLVCQTCHTTKNHRIAGRGSDLRQTDLDVKMSCSTSTCHPTMLSPTGHATADINKHINKVACQTCHIKQYARNAADTAATEATEVKRDWRYPEWHTANNRYEPTVTIANNLKPVYKFWNSTSWGYSLGDPASIDPATGRYPTSRPIGGINDANSKLYPFKYKTAVRPYASNLGILIPVDTKVYFGTGNADAAIKSSLALMGYSNTEPYTWVEDDTYQLITHEVMTKDKSLTCNECHTSSATQMNLKGMGYTLKGTASSVCSQCHSYKDPSSMTYISMHKKHVTDKKYDCSKCHNFTRVATSTYTLSVSKAGTGSGTVTSSPAGISCGADCSEPYSSGTSVILTATAASGSTFAGWSGDSDCSDGAVTMNANKTCTATFNQTTSTTSDLVVSALTVPTGTIPGATITIKDTTKNQGTGTAGASTTKFYWSTNNTYESGDIYLGSRAMPSLASGATNSGSVNVTVPSGISTGTYYIIARADADNAVAETNETNNNRNKSIAIGPDLTVSSITAPSSATRGSTITVGDSTKNSGGSSAGASATKFYLSTNNKYETGDVYLGSRSIPSLASGATNSGSISITIPSGISAGSYYIIAVADANKVVIEASETNNTKNRAITINQ